MKRLAVYEECRRFAIFVPSHPTSSYISTDAEKQMCQHWQVWDGVKHQEGVAFSQGRPYHKGDEAIA